MKLPYISVVSALAAFVFHGTCLATNDATCLLYQPIDMRGEASVIRMPEHGFIILPIPYLSGFSVPEKPYDAITRPYVMLCMRLHYQEEKMDSNLISRAGIKIRSNCTYDGVRVKEEVVSVDFSGFLANDYDPSLEVIAEATLECIRRTATDERQNWRRPVLKIIGNPKDDAMWRRWEEVFNKQKFSVPFKRPEPNKAEQDGAGQPATRSKPKSNGSQKPQPDSEGRSR